MSASCPGSTTPRSMTVRPTRSSSGRRITPSTTRACTSSRSTTCRIALLTHRPLFPLYPQWDWATRDGEQAIELLMPYRNVVVFYGHIHQEHHFKTGHIEHHSAKSLIFPLPAPGSMPKR